jgi:hypothetical protein
MKNKLKLISSLAIALLLTTFGCSSDDSGSAANNEVTLQNLEVTTDENPTVGLTIGTVLTTGNGVLNFSIINQTPAGALTINSSTGELTVADAALFDYESNPIITAEVSSVDAVNTATVTIGLTDINEIGEYKFGGVIFWINSSGNQGLVCATTDQSTGIQWHNGSSVITDALGKLIGTGQANTTTIINAQGTGSYAAKLCDDLSLNGFSDWFLPSTDELNEMRNNKSIIDATSTANSGTAIEEALYWSSTEYSESPLHAAEALSFTSSSAIFLSFKSTTNKVRAIRDWTDF